MDEQTVKFWTAVSDFETGSWTSPIFIQNRNLFGMRLPTSNTTAIGGADGHAVFASLQDSVADLILYFNRLQWPMLNFSTIDALVSMMKSKGYFAAPIGDYLAGVKARYQRLYPGEYV